MGDEYEKEPNKADEEYAGQQEDPADHEEDFVPQADHTEFTEMAQKTELGKTSPILASLFPDQNTTDAGQENTDRTDRTAAEAVIDDAPAAEAVIDDAPAAEAVIDDKTRADLDKRDEKAGKGKSAGLFSRMKNSIGALFGRKKQVPQTQVDVTGLPDEMKSCAEGIAGAKERISQMEKLGKKDKKAVLASLGQAEGWLADLAGYLKRPVNYAEEDVFDASVMTVMSLFGYVEKSLRKTEKKLKSAKGKKGRELLDAEAAKLKQLAGSFIEYKERVPGYAQDQRAGLMAQQERPSLSMLDIVNGAKRDIKTFSINAQTEILGAQASEVFKVEKDGKAYYFKEDEVVRDLKDAAAEFLPILQNEGLERKLKDFIDGLQGDDLDQAGQNIGFLGEDGAIDKGKQRFFARLIGDAWKDVEAYINANGRERWISFASGFMRAWATKSVTEGEDLQIDVNANMTARNFASERVAELLGLKGLIIHNTEAYVVGENGERRKGFVMDQAKGVPAAKLVEISAEKDYPIHFTEEAQKQLLNLQMLDNITGQIDRHANNYFVEYEEEYDKDTSEMCLVVKSVVGIDNDFAFGKNIEIHDRGNNTSSVLKKLEKLSEEDAGGRRRKKKKDKNQNEVEYEYIPGMIDRKMYQSLITLTPELLAINLENVIEPEYLKPLQRRYKIIRDAVIEAKRKADEQKIDFFREKTESWGMDSQKALVDKDKDDQTFLADLLNDRAIMKRRLDRKKKLALERAQQALL